MNNIIKTPKTPYYAVIFTSIRTLGDKGYGKMGEEIEKEISDQIGFLGAESMRNDQGFGVTISYWKNLESINKWKKNPLHIIAKEKGKKLWYYNYMLRLCKVEYDHYFDKKPQ